MKRILCALLACLLLTAPVLTSCTSTPDDSVNPNPAGTTTASDENQEPAQPDPKDAKYDSITIGGVNLSEYQIVYEPDTYAEVMAQYPNSFATDVDTHYAKIMAEELAADLKNMTGIDVPVVASTAAATDHEILVGRTGHTEAEDSRVNKDIDADIYKIAMLEPGKLWLCGGSPAAMYDTLNVLYTEFANQGVKDVVIPETYSAQAKADVITISCIGDSITDGYNCSNRTYCAWPAVMQRILWKDYAVSNFGASGMTMRTDHKDAYINCGYYNDAIALAPEADITIIMLGTNDSDRFKSWDDDDTKKYKEDYAAFLDTLTELNPDVEFILMNCPEYYGGTGKDGEFGSDRMVQIQKDVYEEFKAEGRKVSAFDMHTFTAEEMGSAMFPDKLHPGDEGYSVMGQRMAEMVLAYVNGTEDALLTK